MQDLIIKKIYIDKKVRNKRLTKVILGRFPDIPAETFNAPSPIYNELVEKYADPFLEGKKVLVLSDFKGDFLKKCPGTKGFICCNYYVLNLTTNCPLDSSGIS
jgi:spore photoproduct lyase